MTSKDKLRMIVERLSEQEAADLLAQLDSTSRTQTTSQPLSFAGLGRSGQHDLSVRSREILRNEFPLR